MDAGKESETSVKGRTTVERKSERELVVTRTINAPARIVYDAWTKPELFRQWWVPKSFGLTLLSCDLDVRVGGQYRLVFRHGDSQTMAFFGRYLEVIPHSRLVWTNEEGEDAGPVTTATFEEKGGKTLVVLHELYPSKESLDAAMASGEKSGMDETFEQLDELVVTLSGSSA
ncbi:MAG: SRPBCC family protein [Vicinamibacterales bacterium]